MIIFAELVNFNKSEEECESRQDRMLYLLKNSGSLLAPPSWSDHEKYSPILAACDIGDFDRDKRNKYDTDMYDEKRRKGEIAAALEMGEAAGMEKGRAEGRESANLASAAKLKALGVADEIISQATGLSIETIEGL